MDTNAYAAFKRGLPDAVQIIQHAPVINVSVIVLGELFGGFAAGTRKGQNKRELETFLASGRVQVSEIDEKIAERYAVVYYNLKQKGNPIPTNDMWIAATAIQHDHALYSYDRHFQAIDGLVVGTKLDQFIL